jgi:hypothetical protein
METTIVTIVRADGWEERHELLTNRVLHDVGELLESQRLDVYRVKGADVLVAPDHMAPEHALLPLNRIAVGLTQQAIRGDIALIPAEALR